MAKKTLTLVSKLLLSALALNDLLAPIVSPYEFRRRALYGRNYRTYRNSINQLRRRGWIRFVDKQGQKFFKLTKKGELEALMAKMLLPGPREKWDGRWRLVIFDIPEDARLLRNHLRWLLKGQGFRKLQASVFISPFALNRQAVRYLQERGLIEFIRILRVDEMDNDKDLRRQFSV